MKKAAIYTRVSTSMQVEKEYNSCEAQKDRIMSYIKSQEDLEFFKEYSDPAFSGSNMERPGLEKLVADIQKGLVNCVVVYKVDRLSRFLLDFCKLLEFFEKRNVGFVSVTQHFDTNTSMGRLILNVLLSFAQFEREMIVDRVKTTLLQRAEKGLLNGGTRAFGYKAVDHKLVFDGKAADAVKSIFELFVKTGSLYKVMDFVRKTDLKKIRKNAPVSVSGISHLLRNRTYLGEMKWAGVWYPERHEPIVSKELFVEAQKLTKEKNVKKRNYKTFFLSGLVRCSDCGSNMSPNFTNKPKKRYYYYKCHKVNKEGKDACNIKEINAERLENFLIDSFSRISKDNQYIETLAFKASYEELAQKGVEPSREVVKNVSENIKIALSGFKKNVANKSQVEKNLILRKLIQKVKYSKEELEVTVSLEETPEFVQRSGLFKESGRMAAGIPATKRWRAGARAFRTPQPRL